AVAIGSAVIDDSTDLRRARARGRFVAARLDDLAARIDDRQWRAATHACAARDESVEHGQTTTRVAVFGVGARERGGRVGVIGLQGERVLPLADRQTSIAAQEIEATKIVARFGVGIVFFCERTGERIVSFVPTDRKSTRLNSSHSQISYAV